METVLWEGLIEGLAELRMMEVGVRSVRQVY